MLSEGALLLCVACSPNDLSGHLEGGTWSPPDGVRISAGAPVCPSDSDGPLAALNGMRAVFYHPTAPCDTPPVQLLITNDGPDTVLVDQIEIGPEPFGVANVKLPWRIPPGGHEPIEISFKTDMPMMRDGAVVFAGKEHCSRVAIRGNAPADGLVSASAYALDFGEVPVGEQSAPQTISYLYQDADSNTDIPLALGPDVSSSPEGLFEIVARTGGQGKFSQCEERGVSVVFNAPDLPGKYEGLLIFEVVPGLMFAQLYGTASNGE